MKGITGEGCCPSASPLVSDGPISLDVQRNGGKRDAPQTPAGLRSREPRLGVYERACPTGFLAGSTTTVWDGNARERPCRFPPGGGWYSPHRNAIPFFSLIFTRCFCIVFSSVFSALSLICVFLGLSMTGRERMKRLTQMASCGG